MLHRRALLATSCAMVLTMAMAGTSDAQNAPRQRAVLELFTSQGCSSCPPADALFVRLAKEPDLIALTYPVDIWDYLGWKDTLAQPGFTARQKGYGHARGDRQVYTPQAVINGEAHAVGSDFMSIDSARRNTAGLKQLEITLSQAGIVWRVEAPASGQKGIVWLVPFDRKHDVKIGRGENSGRSVTYANVVRGLIKLADYTGEAMRMDLPADARSDKTAGFAIFVQSGSEKRPGTILGAAESPRQ